MHIKHLIALTLVSSAFPYAASSQMSAGGVMTKPTLAAKRATHPISLDGKLDDADWSGADVASDFVQRYPDPGKQATLRTEVRVLYDDNALYVGARMFDPHPDSIAAPLARKDPGDVSSDWFDVIFDSYHDRRTAFRFGVNPAGTKLDVYHFNDTDDDESWDGLWDVATRIDSLGWTAEYRIPLSQLRFHGAAGEQVWGLQFYRAVARKDEWSHWVPYLPTTPGFVSSFGEMRGIIGLKPSAPIEVSPYVSARAATGNDDRGSPFRKPVNAAAVAGVDFRIGLGSALSLSGTVNPDFGQVEVDPAIINLSAVETFLPEKRPFFLEGSGIFEFGPPPVSAAYGFSRFVHWRRIGRAPQLSPNAPWFDAPDQTSIIGAAKLSGQLSKGWSLGVVEAMTQREDARIVSPSGVHGTAAVEPLTNYFVLRAKRDLDGGRTTVGLLSTSVIRRLDANSAETLRANAYLFGLDGRHATRDRRWTASGYIVGSRVDGSAPAIAATQRSSVRYFERPDASYLAYDPSRTSLNGHDASLSLVYQGTPWFGSMQLHQTSPGYESNDLGYLSRADLRSLTAAFGATRTNATSLLRDARAMLYTQQAWNFGSTGIYHRYGFTSTAQLPSLWSVSLRGAWKAPSFSDRLSRGGPLLRIPSQWETSASIATDTRRRTILRTGATLEEKGSSGMEGSAFVSLVMRPSPALQLTLAPTFDVQRDAAQFVRAIADTLATSTYARRYVFATLRQRTLSFDARVDWTMTPALSLQFFTQPLASSARFSGYKALQTPRTFAFTVFGRDQGTTTTHPDGTIEIDPDADGPATPFILGDRPNETSFFSRALRANAVLRWEYRSGSMLYVVWQQTRDRAA
ncbi:MAG: DUF5916 domain-containing protein, partial [Gemmatimonadaceae bacterium]